jgi:hypothetical protein
MPGKAPGKGNTDNPEGIPYLKGRAVFDQIHFFGKGGKLPKGHVCQPGKEQNPLGMGAVIVRIGPEKQPVIVGYIGGAEINLCRTLNRREQQYGDD